MTRAEKKAELMALFVAGHAAVDAKIAVETTKFYGLEPDEKDAALTASALYADRAEMMIEMQMKLVEMLVKLMPPP